MATNLMLKISGLAEKATGKSFNELTENFNNRSKRPEVERSGQLPLFPEEDVSALPNYIARTPLFAPIRPGRRAMHNNALLASPEGVEIRYTGVQLDMSDQDVFLRALKRARGVDLNKSILCNRAEFLKDLGWKSSKKTGGFGASAYEWLDQSFQRLTSGTLHIKTKKYKAHLSLIAEWVENVETGDWEYTVGMKIKALFYNYEYAFIDLEKRQLISINIDLTKWLQSYSATHKIGLHRVSVENLKLWCGYNSPTRKFKQSLYKALSELERLNIIVGVSFYKNDSMVQWNRIGSKKD